MMIESYLRYIRYEKNYSSHTVKSYETDLNQFKAYYEIEVGEPFDPVKVDLDLVRNWMVSMSERGDEVSSVRRRLSALRSFYKFLKREGEVQESPLCLLSMPKKRKKMPVFIREEQMSRLIDEISFGDTFSGVRDRMIILMLYSTGIRRSEMVALKVGDVDFLYSYIKVLGKGNKERLIPFGEEMRTEMQRYLRHRSERVVDDCKSFFIRENGLSITSGIVYNVVKNAISLVSSNKKRSPHVLRHSFASSMLNSGADLSVVKELLGHASLSSTEVYTHLALGEIMSSYNQAHPRAAKEKGEKV